MFLVIWYAWLFVLFSAKEMKDVERLRRKEERLIDLLHCILSDTYPDLVDPDSVPN